MPRALWSKGSPAWGLHLPHEARGTKAPRRRTPHQGVRARGLGGTGCPSARAADWGLGWRVDAITHRARERGSCARHAHKRERAGPMPATPVRESPACASSQRWLIPMYSRLSLRTDAALMARLRNERALEESVCACSSYAQCVACRRRDGRALRTAASSGRTSAGR